MKDTLTFNQKLGLLQSKLKPVKKDSVNPHFKSRYVDINGVLEMVKPVLDEVGLIVVQPVLVKEGRMGVATLLMDGDSDAMIESWMPLPDVADPQKVGAAITYFRRFSLVSLLCLEAEDDDGTIASQSVQDTFLTPQPDYVSKMVQGRLQAIGTKCPKCGVGEMKTSMKGSLYCSEKCWLKGESARIDDHQSDELSNIPF